MPGRRENQAGDALFAALTYRRDAATIDSFARELSQKTSDEVEGVAAALQSIGAKAAGLLTHDAFAEAARPRQGDAQGCPAGADFPARALQHLQKASIYFTLVVFISLPAMLWWKPH